MNRLYVNFLVVGALVAALGVPLAFAAEPAQIVDSTIGPVLADPEGRTLYTFAKDAAGQSNCTGACAENWPPFVAGDDAQPEGHWTLVTREDGQKQWAYKGMPVYTWMDDQNPGDTTGHGKNDAWHAAKP